MNNLFYVFLAVVSMLTAALVITLLSDRMSTTPVERRNNKILRLRANGMPIRKIARKVNINKSQVHNICKKNGL